MALISILCAGFLSCSLACDGLGRPGVRGMMAPLVDSRRSKLFAHTISISRLFKIGHLVMSCRYLCWNHSSGRHVKYFLCPKVSACLGLLDY